MKHGGRRLLNLILQPHLMLLDIAWQPDPKLLDLDRSPNLENIRSGSASNKQTINKLLCFFFSFIMLFFFKSFSAYCKESLCLHYIIKPVKLANKVRVNFWTSKKKSKSKLNKLGETWWINWLKLISFRKHVKTEGFYYN
jgi:hypothetical protein